MHKEKKQPSIQKMFGQLFIAPWNEEEAKGEAITLITQHHIGGFLLHQEAIKKEKKIKKLTQRLQAYALQEAPLLIAIDASQDERIPVLPSLPSIQTFQAMTNRLYAEQFTEAIGDKLRELGINTIFYPSLEEEEKLDRTTLETTASYGSNLVKGFHKSELATCLTDYPREDAIDLHTRSDRKSSDLYPFYKILTEQGSLLLLKDYAAETIDHYVRQHLNFNGIIIYDLRGEGSSLKSERILDLLDAGVDCFILPEDFEYQTAILTELFDHLEKTEKKGIVQSFHKLNQLKKAFNFDKLEREKPLTPYQRKRLIERITTS